MKLKRQNNETLFRIPKPRKSLERIFVTIFKSRFFFFFLVVRDVIFDFLSYLIDTLISSPLYVFAKRNRITRENLGGGACAREGKGEEKFSVESYTSLPSANQTSLDLKCKLDGIR